MVSRKSKLEKARRDCYKEPEEDTTEENVPDNTKLQQKIEQNYKFDTCYNIREELVKYDSVNGLPLTEYLTKENIENFIKNIEKM